jgi:photosystem II stability/assembly factor-like uncharacterized protein
MINYKAIPQLLRHELAFIIIFFSFCGFPVLASEQIEYEYHNALVGEGGWITGMVIHPKDYTTYVRTDVGGAYRLDRKSMTWVPLLDHLRCSQEAYYQIDGIALDPNNSNIVYLAAGKGGYAGAYYGKGMILKSMDKGKTWEMLKIGAHFFGNYKARYGGERIAVDPYNSNIVYCGSRMEGLFKSSNGGKYWEKVTFPGKPDNKIGILSIVFDHENKGTIYVNAYGDGIYVSRNNGKDWSRLSGNNAPKKVLRMVLAKNNDLYVSARSGVFHYSSKWHNITPDKNIKEYCGIDIDPFNSNRIITAPVSSAGFYKIFLSDNKGCSWREINYANSTIKFSVPWFEKYMWAAAIAPLLFDPSSKNRVWFADWHGIYKTEDISADNIVWDNIQSGHEEFTTRSVRSIPVRATTLAVGGADIGGMLINAYDEYPRNRIRGVSMGEIYSWDFCENDPNFIAVAGGRRKHLGRVAFSVNGGMEFQYTKSQPRGMALKIAVSATDSRCMLVTTSGGPVFRTKDRGRSWQIVSSLPEKTPKGPWSWSRQLESDRLNGNIFYYIDDKNGNFYRSTNKGKQFNIVSKLQLPRKRQDRRWIYLVPSFVREGEIWLSMHDQGLFYSVDGGRKFQKSKNVQFSFCVCLGKSAPGKINPAIYLYGVINNKEGLFRSVDNGQNWIYIDSEKSGFGNYPRTMDGSRSHFGLVFCGTAGRGVRYGHPRGLDVLAPKIKINKKILTRDGKLILKASINEKAKVKVNGRRIECDEKYHFQRSIDLKDGRNIIDIKAVDENNNIGVRRLEIVK